MSIHRQDLSKHPVARASLLFLGVYLVTLLLWVQIMLPYAHVMTFVSSKVVAAVKGMRLQDLNREGARILAVFTVRSFRGGPTVDLEIPVSPSSFTFNVPLTVAILASLQGFIVRRVRAYGESLVILAGVHLLYVFSLCANSATVVMAGKGLGAAGEAPLFFYQFLWGFTDNMIIRFEPFLLGLYVFMRFRRKG